MNVCNLFHIGCLCEHWFHIGWKNWCGHKKPYPLCFYFEFPSLSPLSLRISRFTSFPFILNLSIIATFLLPPLCFLLLFLWGRSVESIKKQESMKGKNDLSNVISDAFKVSEPLHCRCKISIADLVTLHLFCEPSIAGCTYC